MAQYGIYHLHQLSASLVNICCVSNAITAAHGVEQADYFNLHLG